MSEVDRIVRNTLKNCIDTTYAYPLVIKSGEGCYLEDVDGKKFLDFNSNVCSCPIGYGHPEIVQLIEKIAKSGAHKVAGQDFFTEEQSQLAQKLLSIMPSNLNKVFFISTGTEAVENAIKLSFRKRSEALKKQPNELFGISCYGAFHGRTLGSLTFTYSKNVHKKGYPELNVKRIKFKTEDDKENEIKDVIRENPDEVAFVITEVVQGEGGYNIASRKFIRELREETERYRIPLIIDEVQSGLGRTGKWWGFENYGIVPDFVSSSKALQVGATIFNEKFDPKEQGAVSSTWGGGSRIDLAVGLKTIEIIEREKLLKNAEDMGKYILKRIKDWEKDYQGVVVNTNGLGLMLRVEFDTKENRNFVEDKAFKDGLLLLGCGQKTIRLAPPLSIMEDDIDKGLDIMENQIKKIK
ncbi:MAG TPA: aminotransferase class III-fold pyridoxal phosphate-dependent enzyme [archaeon]|nr:aminotransferase class III-fold pyridoxal phosphate-dependent enzyme [archaeon]